MSLSMYSRWYHGNIGREQTEKLLQPFHNGMFLVHDSQNFPGCYTLSVRFVQKETLSNIAVFSICIFINGVTVQYSFEDKVKHYKVWRHMTGRLTADNEHAAF